MPANYDSIAGWNWRVLELPWIVQVNTDPTFVAYLFDGTPIRFNKDASNNYIPVNDARNQYTLTHDATAKKYTLTARLAESFWTIVYHDFTTPQNGAVHKLIEPNGREINVTYDTATQQNRPVEMQTVVTANGNTTIYSIKYDYYSSTDSAAFKLKDVTLRKDVNGGGFTNLRQVHYDYCGSSDPDGSLNDLKRVTLRSYNGSSWNDIAVNYYRYYKTVSATGIPHRLKYVLGPESYRRLIAGGKSESSTDADIKVYADYYFEYDSNGRVTKEIAHGNCGGCGGGGGTGGGETFTRDTNPNYPAAPSDPFNTWKTKTVVVHADGTETHVYTNHVGQPILNIFKDASGNLWRHFFRYGADGQITHSAMPSAVSGHNESKNDLVDFGQPGNHLRDSVGLIERTFRYTSTTATDTTPGGVQGYTEYKAVQQGENGSPIKTVSYTYTSRNAGGKTNYLIAAKSYHPDAGNPSQTVTTSYSYAYHPSSTLVKTITETLPVVSTSQNGSGTAATIMREFDTDGRLTWSKDARGVLTYHAYDPVTRLLTQRIDDVNTSILSAPNGWTTASGFGLHAVNTFVYDDLSRLVEEVGPTHSVQVGSSAKTVQSVNWTVYVEQSPTNLDEVRVATGYREGTTDTLVNPVSIRKVSKDGKETYERYTAARASTAGKLLASDSFPLSSYLSWTVNSYHTDGHLESTRVYHQIPSTSPGSLGTHYSETTFGYDEASDRRVMVKSPAGTITRTVFDGKGRMIQTWVGTDDTGATAADPDGSGAPNNMVLVAAYEYDNTPGSGGGGSSGGDGNLTKVTQYASATDARVTTYAYDFRNRRISEDGEVDAFAQYTYDNLDRLTQVDRRDTTSGGNLIARSTTSYDDRSRVYRTTTFGVDPATGAITSGGGLSSNTWYDDEGNVLKTQSPGQTFTKMAYDGLGRVTATYIGYDTAETATPTYAAAANVTGDTVLEQTNTTYDILGNPRNTTTLLRHHDATGTGALTWDTQPKGRPSYSANFYTPGSEVTGSCCRLLATALYGTNSSTSGGQAAAPTWPTTVPARSDTVLVTSYAYDDAGRVSTVTDPKGLITKTHYDAMDRTTATIENYQSGSTFWTAEPLQPKSRAADTNRVTAYTYTPDSQIATLTAIDPNADGTTTDNQVTTYVYGVSPGSGSDLATNNLLRATIYPDSDDTASPLGSGGDSTFDRVELAYNALGQIKTRKDQREVELSYDYDKLGRLTQERVVSLGRPGENVDGAVRRIFRGYEVRGMLASVQSWDNPTPGSGATLNEVKHVYNTFGQLTQQQQEHSGAATASSLKVSYAYANGSNATQVIRPTTMTYPNGRVLTYNYGTSGGVNDNLSRVQELRDGTNVQAAYLYNGLGSVIQTQYTQGQVRLQLQGGSGLYTGLDRFGRLTRQQWTKYTATTATLWHANHNYDRNSNRLYRDMQTPTTGRDELYAYDSLDRLLDVQRGSIANPFTSITSGTFRQTYGLEQLGNWNTFKEYASSTTTVTLDQTRTHNLANELGVIGATVGSNWSDPTHDAAGNMTSLPQPNAPTNSFTCRYDAWNRLVRISDGANVVAEYTYDGLGRRIVKLIYNAGTLSETRHQYWSRGWQLLEERVGTTPGTARVDTSYVWGLRYIDELVSRDRDTNPGTAGLEERLFALHDAMFSVTAMVNTSGGVQERYDYTPYGERKVFDAAWAPRASSTISSYIAHQGIYQDAETGLLQNRRRDRHVQLGRWMQHDPLQYVDGLNLYVYALSNPANWSDPMGLQGGPGQSRGRGGNRTACCGGQTYNPRSEGCCKSQKSNVPSTVYSKRYQCCQNGIVVHKRPFWERNGYPDSSSCRAACRQSWGVPGAWMITGIGAPISVLIKIPIVLPFPAYGLGSGAGCAIACEQMGCP